MRLERSRVQLPAEPLSGNDRGKVVHTYAPLSPSSIIWAATFCNWEGNRKSGVALAMRHIKWFIHLRAQGLIREMSTPPTLLMGYGTL